MIAARAIALCALFTLADANAFRKSQSFMVAGKVDQDALKKALLEEVEGHFTSATIRSRVVRLESAMWSMYQSLPKNEHGNLAHGTVRYALHRVFVQKHGWYIKGLERNGGSWNETTHANILKEQAAEFVQSIFEHRLGDRGLNLHELAVVAATLEHLIHDEADDRLAQAYKALNWEATRTVNLAEAINVIDEYLKVFILGEEESVVDDAVMTQVYPGWIDTKKFAHDIMRDTAVKAVDNSKLTFEDVLHAAEDIADQYGRFQDGECRSMKSALVALGDHGVGRVPLSDFYRPALSGTGTGWQFMESAAYLRSIGALDETDPMPAVIVPNYVSSQSNCVVSTSYYSVCCMDECEGLMGQLERDFQSPDANPKQIAALVADMSSSSVTAPRVLPAPLLEKLDDIAAGHQGTVPLHGRLFAQWMHHAFPRECPYPHMSGTTTGPHTANEWFGEEKSMEHYVNAAPQKPAERDVLLQWSHEEELLAPITRRSSPSLWSSSRSFMLMASLVAVGVRLVMTTKKTSAAMELPIFGERKGGKFV